MTEDDAEENLTLANRLCKIEALEQELMANTVALWQKNMNLYQSDFFIAGAMNRVVAQSAGFRDLIAAKNFPCAAGILRMQIDTAMRLNAIMLVKDVDEFFRDVSEGKRFDKLCAADGQKLTDRYLRIKLTEKYSWITPVYESASDFVHLSMRHFYASIESMDDDTRTIRFSIGARDPSRPDDSYFEIVDAFFEVSKIAVLILLGYHHSRNDFSNEASSASAMG